MGVETITLGDFEQLRKLINSNPSDLIKLFKARKKDNTYIIPLLKAPWIISIDLGYQYSLESNEGRLSVEGVSFRVLSKQARAIAGFLASNGFIYGTYIGGRGRFKCIRVNVTVPIGLTIPLNNVEFESTQAYVSAHEGKIIVPECSLINSTGLTTSRLIIAALNSQAMGNVVVEFSTLKVLYL
ncbi:hypothetical protein [Caldivirga maquilingensis]|uniref:Uncharacterized protein n=1 Tax=Caldivirga maquilingensis (strain ATCC 700844 / DSM 13496 / JCM 10307 / IC-167) TaxID=397948 RepID=A8MB65_CALMQ|nr:hypothetical protein [Caldivirga maquilingensis]ABW01155.1 hypothetical protein Cmaq_0307 [Caldivirga maquilingensis IC-167]